MRTQSASSGRSKRSASIASYRWANGTFGTSYESSWTTITRNGIITASGTSSSTGHSSNEPAVPSAAAGEWAAFSITTTGRQHECGAVRVWDIYGPNSDHESDTVLSTRERGQTLSRAAVRA